MDGDIALAVAEMIRLGKEGDAHFRGTSDGTIWFEFQSAEIFTQFMGAADDVCVGQFLQ